MLWVDVFFSPFLRNVRAILTLAYRTLLYSSSFHAAPSSFAQGSSPSLLRSEMSRFLGSLRSMLDRLRDCILL